MGFSDINSTDDFDRTDVVIGDKDDPSRVAKVDHNGNQEVKLGRGSQVDMWGRVRTSVPITEYELNFLYSSRPDQMLQKVTGTGDVVHDPDRSGVLMTIGTSVNDKVIKQTRKYIRYLTGKSTQVLLACIPNQGKTNVSKCWGMFDDFNGVFFDQLDGGFGVTIRTSTSGSVVNNRFPQSSWNLDKLDGTGPSGINLDPTKYNVYVMEYAWQGAGGVKFGILIGNDIVYAHEFKPFNTLANAFTQSPILPVRYSMENVGGTSSSSDFFHGTLGVVSEGGTPGSPSTQFSASTSTSPILVNGNDIPILTIRPKLNYNGKINRIPIELTGATLSALNDIVYFKLILNGTLNGGTFTSANSLSSVEFSTNVTSVTGGIVVDEGYVLAAQQGNSTTFGSDTITLNKNNFLSLDIDGTSQDNFTLVASTVQGNTEVLSMIKWEEFQ